VGLPVYNGARYLEAALTNLTSSDHDGLVVVVSDNASTDGTPDIIRTAARRDERIRSVRHDENVGANRNFNGLVQHCRTPYFKWAAVDDLVDPALLAASLDALEDDPHAVLAYGDPVLIDDDGYPLSQVVETTPRATQATPSARFADVLANEVWCTSVFGVMRSDVLRSTALLRPFYGADKVLLSELAVKGRFLRVEPSFYRRCHDEQSTVLDAKAKAEWTAGRRSGRTPAVLQATAAYLDVARRADAALTDRARMLGSVAGTTIRVDRLKKAFLPGPYNYFGWTGRGPKAYDGLDMSRQSGRSAVRA
jgi:glycosyltransferase involved in cell wall biosynthesis